MGMFDFFKKPDTTTSNSGKVKDPVCGMMLYPSKAEGEDTRQGQHFWFCSINCQQTFRRNPLNFMGGTGPGANTAPAPTRSK